MPGQSAYDFSGWRNAAEPPAPPPPRKALKYPLKRYLEQTWLPAFQFGSHAIDDWQWPIYPELQAELGSRPLRRVSRIPADKLAQATFVWCREMPDVLVDIRPGEKSNGESLTLPSTELIVGGEDDRVYLCEDVNKVTDISRLLSMYTLRTVARSLRRFYGVEEGTAFSQTLQFHNAFHLCPAKGARWDLMAVPGYQEDTIAMILVVVPPWEFDLTEFQNFALEGVPAVGSVEHIPTNTVPNACTILWALLWSICNKWKCRYFAVTTYQHWAFGNISERGYRAQVTDVIEAPVYCAEEQVPKEVLPRPNLAEILTFWMGASLGGAGGIWEVPNDLPKDVFGTVEKPQKPQTGEGTSKATAA